MRFPMFFESYGGGRENHSFDQLRFLEMGHRAIAALKFGAGEPIALFQRRQDRGNSIRQRDGCASLCHA